MLAVDECVFESQEVVVIILVQFGVELFKTGLANECPSGGRASCRTKSRTDTSIMLWLK